MRNTFFICALLTAISLGETQAYATEAPPLYKITKTVALGNPDRWDYIVFDADSDRVYVAHGTEVSVVDSHTAKVIGIQRSWAGCMVEGRQLECWRKCWLPA